MRWGVVSSSELGDNWSAEAHLDVEGHVGAGSGAGDLGGDVLAGPVAPDAVVRRPIDVECPACFAQPGHRCSAPTVSGRALVEWVHSARKDLAEGWT